MKRLTIIFLLILMAFPSWAVDTTMLQGLINRGGQIDITRFYHVSSPLIIDRDDVTFAGRGHSTGIIQTTPGVDLIRTIGTASRTTIKDLWFAGPIPSFGGAVIALTSSGNPGLIANNVIVSGGYDNIRFKGPYSSYVSNFTFTWATRNFLTIEEPTMGVSLVNGQISGNNGNRGAGIDWQGGTGLYVSNVDIYMTGVGIKITPGPGKTCAHGYFSNVTAENPAINNPVWWIGGDGGNVSMIKVLGGWAGLATGTGSGVLLRSGVDDAEFTGFSAYGNSSNGFLASGGGWAINGGSYRNNIVGIGIFPGVSDYRIQNASIRNNSWVNILDGGQEPKIINNNF